MARLEEHLPFPVTPVDAETGEDVDPRSDLGRLPWTAFVIIAVMMVVAVFAPLIAPHSPTEQSLPDKLKPPAWQEGGSAKHLLGTDLLGRHLFSRLLARGRG